MVFYEKKSLFLGLLLHLMDPLPLNLVRGLSRDEVNTQIDLCFSIHSDYVSEYSSSDIEAEAIIVNLNSFRFRCLRIKLLFGQTLINLTLFCN